MFESVLIGIWFAVAIGIGVGTSVAAYWHYLPNLHVRKIGWMALDNRVPPPVIEGNSILLGLPGDILINHANEFGPAMGRFSMAQWIKLPADVPAIISGNSEVLPGDLRVKTEFLPSNWFGDVIIDLENYGSDGEPPLISAGTAFIRVTLVGHYTFKVVEVDEVI